MRRTTLALAAFLLVVGLIAFRYTVYDPTRWTYRYHQRELAAIVARIKLQQIPIDSTRDFEVAHSLDPTTLSPYKDADQYTLYHIEAYRREQDDYLISIEIDDEGHNGTNSLLYTDLPLKVVPVLDAHGGLIPVEDPSRGFPNHEN
jgi:hypothetical protein